jgi:hypothetical protein
MLIAYSFEGSDENDPEYSQRVIEELFKIIKQIDPDSSEKEIAMLVAANLAIQDLREGEDDFNVDRN